MKDVEGGAFSKRTHYSEAISRSLGYSVLNAIKSTTRDTIEASNVGAEIMKKVNQWFSIEDPYIGSLGPMQRAVVEKWLKKLQTVQTEVLEWMRVAVKEDPDRAIDVIYDKLRNHLDAPVEPHLVSKILGAIGETGIVGQRTAQDATQGWLKFLSEFTEAEAARNAADISAMRAGEDLPPAPAVLSGEDVMFSHEGGKRWDFFDPSDMSIEESSSRPVRMVLNLSLNTS
jgi:hypothetical protein